MKRLSTKRRDWLLKKSQKAMRRLEKHNRKSRRSVYCAGSTATVSRKGARKELKVVVPQCFSLSNNADETTMFIQNVLNRIKRCKPNDTIFFDLSAVTSITADAIMFLIAIIYNTKKVQQLNIHCKGNDPADENAKKMLIDSGFYQYVASRVFRPKESTDDRIQIRRGIRSDCKTAQQLCDFVHMQTNNIIDRIHTKRLFPMFVELMNNTKQHAYLNDASCLMYSNWYVYAESHDKSIQFIFLDTGVGIPKTIKKSVLERTLDFFRENDAEYIASTLRGEFRTVTREDNRGKGLPEIYANIGNGAILSLSILSGRGMCNVSSDGRISECAIGTEFPGTMFIWDISKEVVK